MSTDRATLAATNREVTGKKVAHLRHAGQLPAVVYGHGIESANVAVDAHEFDLLRRHIGPNALVDLSIDGKKARPVLIHGVQFHPIHRRPLHVDLFLVRMTEEMTVDVPLSAVGDSIAISQYGGTLLHPIESVKVRALPANLPQVIEFSIESLTDFEGAIHVRDLTIPADVALITDPEEIVAKVQAPRVEEAVVPAAAEAEAEAAEGAEGAGSGDTAGGGDSTGD